MTRAFAKRLVERVDAETLGDPMCKACEGLGSVEVDETGAPCKRPPGNRTFKRCVCTDKVETARNCLDRSR